MGYFGGMGGEQTPGRRGWGESALLKRGGFDHSEEKERPLIVRKNEWVELLYPTARMNATCNI